LNDPENHKEIIQYEHEFVGIVKIIYIFILSAICFALFSEFQRYSDNGDMLSLFLMILYLIVGMVALLSISFSIGYRVEMDHYGISGNMFKATPFKITSKMEIRTGPSRIPWYDLDYAIVFHHDMLKISKVTLLLKNGKKILHVYKGKYAFDVSEKFGEKLKKYGIRVEYEANVKKPLFSQ